jgi:methionine synthase I (cobalamin-dependent)
MQTTTRYGSGGGPVLTDGAWGTQLQARGLPPGSCPDAWNLTQPEAVAGVARDYAAAGSQIVLTNTFGANRITLARTDWAGETAAINREGVALSRLGASGQALVYASIGPTGLLLGTGEGFEAEVAAAFAEQARALASAGPDALVVETMADLQEAQLAVRAACETGLPVVACMTFGAGRNGDRTIMGVSPEQSAEALAAAGAGVIGTNCGNGPAELRPVCDRLRAATGLPLWVKPNAGRPQVENGATVYPTTPEEFAAQALELAAAGANFIGGCCGTGPAFIRALAAAIAEGSRH